MSRALVMSDYADPDTEIERLWESLELMHLQRTTILDELERQEKVIEAAKALVDNRVALAEPPDFAALRSALAALEGKVGG